MPRARSWAASASEHTKNNKGGGGGVLRKLSRRSKHENSSLLSSPKTALPLEEVSRVQRDWNYDFARNHHPRDWAQQQLQITRHLRTRSIPLIEDLENCDPEVPQKKDISVFVKSVNDRASAGVENMPAKKTGLVIDPVPARSFWNWFPSAPSSTYSNPRNELQRRPSPTSPALTSPALSLFPKRTDSLPLYRREKDSPPLTPLTPMTPLSPPPFGGGPEKFRLLHSNHTAPAFNTMDEEEQVFVLTLKTSSEIAAQMQNLRQKWFPTHILKVPAHVTLFHALPESRLPEIETQIYQLMNNTSCFEISAGRVQRMRKGVLVNLDKGDADVRVLYGRLCAAFYEWLSEQDKHCKAHWTIQNKEEDQMRVGEAFKDTCNTATGKGVATGLVLWRYGDDGRWTKEKEYEFLPSAV